MGAAHRTNSKRRRPDGATADARLPKRRKSPEETRPRSRSPEPPKSAGPAPRRLALSAFHEATLAELRSKYDVLVVSVISSTKVGKRVERILGHLRRAKTQTGGEQAAGPMPLALLHARPAEICKMITVAEKAKDVLASEGGFVYQYNHLFELPPQPPEPSVVEETVLAAGEEDSGEGSDDGFEKLEIYDKAANPKAEPRPVRSMGVFLSVEPVPELKAKAGVTVQTAGKPVNAD